MKASPDLVNVASLSSSVATFGSQMNDLEQTTKQLKEHNTKLAETTSILQQNITSLKVCMLFVHDNSVNYINHGTKIIIFTTILNIIRKTRRHHIITLII